MRIDASVLVVAGLGLLVSACEVSQEEAEALSVSWIEDGELPAEARLTGSGFGGGASCTTFDGTTTGCEEDEVCLPVACTNAIPPFCFGFCQTGFTFP